VQIGFCALRNVQTFELHCSYVYSIIRTRVQHNEQFEPSTFLWVASRLQSTCSWAPRRKSLHSSVNGRIYQQQAVTHENTIEAQNAKIERGASATARKGSRVSVGSTSMLQNKDTKLFVSRLCVANRFSNCYESKRKMSMSFMRILRMMTLITNE